jgi:hypothetical protein
MVLVQLFEDVLHVGEVNAGIIILAERDLQRGET